MSIFKYIPLFLYLLVAYLITFYIQGNEAITTLSSSIYQLTLFSGAIFSMTWNGVFLTLGVLFLFIEIIKSTRTSNASIIDHMLSSLVFIGFLVVFIIKPGAATEGFFVVMLMSLIDVIAGFSITITSARKDFGFNH
ncbi:MAG: hypothetical protein QM504_09910 [Pseudomonadota bacterium]